MYVYIYNIGEKSLSHVWLFAIPWTVAYQALPPWDFSGKNTGVGCHFLLQESHSVVSDSLQPHGLYSPWNFPAQNTGVGNLSLLQGIFPTQGSKPRLHMQADSLPAEY